MAVDKIVLMKIPLWWHGEPECSAIGDQTQLNLELFFIIHGQITVFGWREEAEEVTGKALSCVFCGAGSSVHPAENHCIRK